MKKTYVRPIMFYGKEPRGLIPLVAGVAAALGVSQAVAGLALGATAGLGAVAAGTAVAKKVGDNRLARLECLPALDAVMV
ncbi:MAG: hypothetical protein LBU25_06030 [Treponema sp.]|jgi:hypothetical protein|nr:hypothetical protein [Treponema sp.]